MTSLHHKKSNDGFTLVEVALSLAITGFALISLLGMFPVGMANFRLARQATFYSEMVQTLQGSIETTSFSTLTSTPPAPLYFDGQGNPLPSGVGAVYKIQAVVNSNTSANYKSSTALNYQMQNSGSTVNLLYLNFALIYMPNGSTIRQYPYFIGNSGN